MQCSPSVKKWACTPADLCYHTSLLAKPGIMVTHSFFLCTSTAFLLSTRLRCTLKKISGRPGFKTVLPTFQCTSVYFWYIPESLRGLSETEDWWKKVDRVRTVRRTSCCDIHGHRALFDPSSLKKTPSWTGLVFKQLYTLHEIFNFFLSKPAIYWHIVRSTPLQSLIILIQLMNAW